jgi:hypothetical protein
MAKTDTPKVLIFNMETGEEILRDANADELAEIAADKAANNAAIAAKAKAEADKAALLARLGLTEDELKTILG